ncbi:hypothetical protein LEN26_016265 [Aphanomyces euteiches]|nr:hypothetical protein LEN26_016265 [Aphanomyces euteiches]KAH9118544.1 hypothetical protein AeMF1_008369 [Aphanomyces euteiches]
MVENLVQWITSQPIQGVHLTGFVCDNDDLRSALIMALFNSKSLEKLTLKMYLDLVPLIQLNAPNLRYLKLCCCYLKIQELASQLLESNIEVLSLSKNYQESSLESLFEVLPRTKMTTLYLPGCITNGNVKFWQDVVPFLQLSHLKTLNLNRNNIGNAEAIVLADGIRDHKTLQTLHLSFNNFEYDGAISLLQAASPSFKKIYLGRTWKKKCTQEERDELETLDAQKHIQLCE